MQWMGHFQVPLSLSFKMNLGAKSLLSILVSINTEIRSNYRCKNSRFERETDGNSEMVHANVPDPDHS